MRLGMSDAEDLRAGLNPECNGRAYARGRP
ncbi:hypothetical protein BHMPCIPO_06507 [Ensifer sesbaniae]|nr:hypothetical protein [Ensifer sesbaniae]